MESGNGVNKLLFWIVGTLVTVITVLMSLIGMAGGRLYLNMKQIDDAQNASLKRASEFVWRLETLEKKVEILERK